MGVALLLEDLAPNLFKAGRTRGVSSIKSAFGFFACGDLIKTFLDFDLDGVYCLEVSSLEMGEDLKYPNDVRVGLSKDGCLE